VSEAEKVPIKEEEKTGLALLKDLIDKKNKGLLPEKKEDPYMTT